MARGLVRRSQRVHDPVAEVSDMRITPAGRVLFFVELLDDEVFYETYDDEMPTRGRLMQWVWNRLDQPVRIWLK